MSDASPFLNHDNCYEGGMIVMICLGILFAAAMIRLGNDDE